MRSLVPHLVPALPIAVAAAVLALREVRRPAPPVPAQTAVTADATWPESRRDLAAGAPLSAAAESCLRFRLGSGARALRAIADVARARMDVDEQGVPVRLSLSVELATLRRADGGKIGDLAWDVLGVRRRDRLEFEGVRRRVVEGRMPGVRTVEFAGTVRLGTTARYEVIPLRITATGGGRARALAHGVVHRADFRLRRVGLPFAAEAPVVVVWDLAFVPST